METSCSRSTRDQLLLAVQVKYEVSGNFMLQINTDQLLLAVQVKYEVSGNFMLQVNRDQHFLAVQVKLRSVEHHAPDQ